MVVALRRAAGAVVVLLSVLPFFRLIRVDRSGPWGESTVAEAARNYDLALWGTILIAGLAVVLWVWVRQRARSNAEASEPAASPVDRLRPLAAWISKLPRERFSMACGLVAAGLAAIVSTRVFARLLTNVDEMTSVIHARVLEAGRWGAPVGDHAEAWLIPNMLVTDVGWVSQYPPGHLILLAAAERLGVPWLLGPVLLGLMVAFATSAAIRILQTREVEARLAGVVMALSPFLLLLGGGALSHLSAGAAIAASLYFGIRTLDGRVVWALAAGAATGLAVTSRPWTGLVLAPILTLGPWVNQIFVARRSSQRAVADSKIVPRLTLWVLGGLPFAFLFLSYNLQVFGNPLELGYEVLYGPAHKLGFHLDPWGYPYGPREALAYTSADLVRFGVALLDTPVPLTLVVGALLLLAPRLPQGARTFILWSLIPVFANALYWFHQPRMLFESSPGWVVLALIGVGAGLRSAAPATRTVTAVALVACVAVGATAFVPLRFAGNSWSEETLARIVPPVPDVSAGPGLVFVHASWHERVAGRFQAAGMRNDSLQAIVRRNDTCALDRLGRARKGDVVPGWGSALDATVDVTQTSELRPGLTPVATPGGVRVPRLAGVEWTAACERQLRSDRFGAVSLAPLLWQGALPGVPDEGATGARLMMFVRDFGPEANQALIDRFGDRTPWLFAPVEAGGPPRLVPYAEGMALLWGEPTE